MRSLRIPLLLSVIALLPAAAPAAFVPPLPFPERAPATEAAEKPADSEVPRPKAFRQSVLKAPEILLPEPQLRARQPVALRPLELPAALHPSTPPKLAPPPPPPREVTLAERELSLQPTPDTPYDRYTGSIRSVIAQLSPRTADMSRARDLMEEAHGFRYRAADPYRAALPSVTAASRTGDCKAKALWLYDRLGDPSALYVIGKMFKQSKANHAWLYWRVDDRWWILDPTNRIAPLPAATISGDRYVPYYSFGKAGAFRHRATRRFMPDGAPAVAAPSGGRPRVAKR